MSSEINTLKSNNKNWVWLTFTNLDWLVKVSSLPEPKARMLHRPRSGGGFWTSNNQSWWVSLVGLRWHWWMITTWLGCKTEGPNLSSWRQHSTKLTPASPGINRTAEQPASTAPWELSPHCWGFRAWLPEMDQPWSAVATTVFQHRPTSLEQTLAGRQ